MFIRILPTTLLQIFCENLLYFQVIFKSMKIADNSFLGSVNVYEATPFIPFSSTIIRDPHSQRCTGLNLTVAMTKMVGDHHCHVLSSDLSLTHSHSSSSGSIVCYFHTFGNNLGIKRKFAKYFKETCCLSSDQHFSLKCFQKNAFVRKIFPKSSGLFWPL